jgi:multiple sugar transport system substrate-binding protein/raffinose/stachyose/melibiose transport system substrate-binding protein
MKLNRRFLSLAALATALPLALAACSTSEPTTPATSEAPPAAVTTSEAPAPADDTVELTFLTFESPSLDAVFWDTSIARAAEQVGGVKINRIVTGAGDRDTYAQQLQASGQFPDLLASIQVRPFLEAGLIQPYDTAWLEETFVQPYANTIGGQTYMPPTNTQIIPLIFYNKQIFADNGIEEPTTWAELMAVIEKLVGLGITPMENAGADPWANSMYMAGIWATDVLAADPQWLEKRNAGEVKFSDEVSVKAIQKGLDLIAAGAFDPTCLSVDYATANANFLEGKSAMYPMGSWFIGKGYLTDEQAANIGIFPWPSDSGSVILPTVIGGTMVVSANAKDVEKALAFGKAWTADPANFGSLIEDDGSFPMFKQIPFEDYNVSVTPLYDEGFALATGSDPQCASMGWAQNDSALAPGMNDAWYALTQEMFSNSDAAALAANMDAQYDAALAG